MNLIIDRNDLVTLTTPPHFSNTQIHRYEHIHTLYFTLVLLGGGELRLLSLCGCVLVGGECVPRLAWGSRLPPCCLASGETCMAAS